VGRNCQHNINKFHRCLRKQVVDWHCIVVDDASTDNTYKYLKALPQDNFTIIRNSEQRWAAFNRYQALQTIEESEKVVVSLLDLDDLLVDHALNKVQLHYAQTGCKLTMGQFVTKGGARKHPFYSRKEIQNNQFSRSFKFPHLRTFDLDLALTHTEDNFKINDQWMKTCTDVAFCLPLLKEVNCDQVSQIDEILYIYDNSLKTNSTKVFGGKEKKKLFQEYCRRF
jgi:glycosyltransferase involved in cell wall biosynthesis